MRFAYRRPTPRWLVAHNRRRDHPGPPAELNSTLDAAILAELSDTYCVAQQPQSGHESQALA